MCMYDDEDMVAVSVLLAACWLHVLVACYMHVGCRLVACWLHVGCMLIAC